MPSSTGLGRGPGGEEHVESQLCPSQLVGFGLAKKPGTPPAQILDARRRTAGTCEGPGP